MSRLVVCEKPSQARSIAAVLGAKERKDGGTPSASFYSGNGYIVTYCIGHLLELAAPEIYNKDYAKWRQSDLPIIPDKWLHVPLKGKEKQLKIITELMNRMDVEYVINACDAGREGQLIFQLVYDYAKCTKPVKRLWISSMENSAIKAGFENLKDGAEYENLCAAASCRERADWAVGISATRLMSVLYGATLNVGRVLSPTLAMLVNQEAEIENFVKEPFYTPIIELGDLSGFTVSGGKFKDKSEAETIAADCEGKSVTVTDVKCETKTVAPPKLYDLTSLQCDANRLLGYTAQQTLEYVQSLYEKKLTSYPRTDGKYITADMRDTVLKIIGAVDFTPDIDRIIGVISDHHAIIPTLDSRKVDLSVIPSGERKIYELVDSRLIAAVSPKHVYEAVTVTLNCGGHIFTEKGKTIIEAGWTGVAPEPIPRTARDESDDTGDDIFMPELSKDRTFDSVRITVKESFTSPPLRFNEGSLLKFMETAGAEDLPDDVDKKGLGTPATRAGIIEKLVKTGFMERSKKNLIPTDKGKNLIAVLPDALTSANLTAQWEHKLKQVERSELAGDVFMDDIAGFIKEIVSNNTSPKAEFLSLFPVKEANSASLGTCPRCGESVREGAKGFFCSHRTCGFKIWRESKFWTAKKNPLTAEIIATLLKDSRVEVKGLYSGKTGKKYDATVVLDDKGEQFVNFRLEF